MCAGNVSSRDLTAHAIIRDKSKPRRGNIPRSRQLPNAPKLDNDPPKNLQDNLLSSLPISPTAATEGSRRPIFCEIFAGCGRLSRAAKQYGFATLPIDGPRNEHKPECQILTLDLVDGQAQSLLLETIRTLRPEVVHVALPCGTGSRAREKPVPAHLVAQGAPQPRPLRDAKHPLGLPGLSKYEQAKVASANALAQITIELFVIAIAMGSIFSIEKPQ